MTASVRSESAAVSRMAASWPMIRALIGGTSAMREAGEELLPRWPNEEQASYAARLAVATLYPAFARTVEVMAGKPFSKAMTLSEDMPEGIREWCENIDLEGRNLHAFCADRLRECIGYGVSGILVDFPKADGIKTRADEVAAGVRPFFTAYGPGNVLGWRYKTIRGVKRLTMLRLLESVTEDDGDFGEKTVEQVRVLVPGAWQTWRKVATVDGTEEWMMYEEGATTLGAIPFVFLYGERTGFGIGKPPLLELAHQNVEHWQSGSDQQTILHVARVPILTIIGADDATITVGASSAVKLPTGASMSFVEHSGAAISAGRQSLVDLDEMMRATGAELLVQKPGAVTATQVSSENEANKCALQRIAEAFEDAIDEALALLAAWVNEPVSGSAELFKDYGAGSLSDASAQLLVTMQQGGIITKATVIKEQQRRGVLSPDLNADDELEQVSAEGPSLGMVGMGVSDQEDTGATSPKEASVKPVVAAPAPAPVDLSPILAAIEAAKPAPIQPVAADTTVADAISAMGKQIAVLASKVAEPQEAEIDLTPINDQIAILSAQVKAIADKPESDDKAEIKALSDQIAAIANKPEPKQPDLSALQSSIMSDVRLAIASIPQQQQPPIVMMDSQGQIKKQITLTFGADGKPNGATVDQVNG